MVQRIGHSVDPEESEAHSDTGLIAEKPPMNGASPPPRKKVAVDLAGERGFLEQLLEYLGNHSFRHRTLWLTAGGVFLVFTAYLLFIAPLREELSVLRQQIIKTQMFVRKDHTSLKLHLETEPSPAQKKAASAAHRYALKSDLDALVDLVLRTSDAGGVVSTPRKRMTIRLSMMALMEGIEGDFVECGVFVGGTSVLMGRVLEFYGPPGRMLWSADSFKGLPPDKDDGWPRGELGSVVGNIRDAQIGEVGQYASARAVFEENLGRFGLDRSQRVHILEGWFNETLPKAPIKNISFLRADGDIYVSTLDTLKNLYHKVSIGGFVYIDDYGSFSGCKKAVDEFRWSHRITEPMIPVYESFEDGSFEAVWWQKKRPFNFTARPFSELEDPAEVGAPPFEYEAAPPNSGEPGAAAEAEPAKEAAAPAAKAASAGR